MSTTLISSTKYTISHIFTLTLRDNAFTHELRSCKYESRYDTPLCGLKAYFTVTEYRGIRPDSFGRCQTFSLKCQGNFHK